MKYVLSPENYSDIGAPEHVIKWVRDGVPLPFSQEPQECFHQNRVYCDNHALFIDSEISRLLSIGAIKPVKQKPHCVLSMHAVPKKNKKYHLVTDCHPINGSIVCPTFSQEGISAVQSSIQESEILMTLDIKDGFHHVPLAAEFSTYVGIQWRGQFYVWCVLCFGISIVPYYSHKVIRPVVQYLRLHQIRLAPFVDDFLQPFGCPVVKEPHKNRILDCRLCNFRRGYFIIKDLLNH